MTTKMIITNPNFKRAENAAYELLKRSNTQTLPTQVKMLAKMFPNLRIKSYSWFGDKYGMTLEEICVFANSLEGCCYYKKSAQRYIILYNDKVDNYGRIRWTIAHELGHFILKHNELSARTIVARNSLSDEEYEIFEKEANCFARTLLAPPGVITSLGIEDPTMLSELCGISFEAASNIASFLSKGLNMGVNYTKGKIMTLFKEFILDHRLVTCTTCTNKFMLKSSTYCRICGGSKFSNKRGGFNMIYNVIALDDEHRAEVCPVCSNELTLGDYCHICGIYLINRCSNFDPSSLKYPFIGKWHLQNTDCGELLSGDARFCTKCGSTSTYLEQGILKKWEDEMDELFPN